jgi:hypothetical protein
MQPEVKGCCAMEASGDVRFRLLAEQFAAFVEQQTGSVLDLDLDSLGVLDAVLTEWVDFATVYDAQNREVLEHLVTPAASYIGEVLVRTIGASWEPMGEQDEEAATLRLPSGQRVDLGESVRSVLAGRARPAFHELAESLAPSPPRECRL